MIRLGLWTVAVTAATYAIHPADTVEARVRAAAYRFAAIDARLDRAHDRPSALRAIRSLDRVETLSGLNRPFGDRVMRAASAESRDAAELAVAEMRQRLGRRLARWFDDGWLTGAEFRRSRFLRMVCGSFRREVESKCEAISHEEYALYNRGFCHWPELAELRQLVAIPHDSPNRPTLLLRPDHFLNPWGGGFSLTVVETPLGPKPMVMADVLTEAGWEQVTFLSIRNPD